MPEPRLEVVERLDEATRGAVGDLLASAAAAAGHPPFNDAALIDLETWPEGVTAVVARDAGSGRLAGYAQLGRAPTGATLAAVLDPGMHTGRPRLLRRLLAEALDVARARGANRVTAWLSRPTAPMDDAARAAGLVPSREVLQLRTPLPLRAGVRAGVAPVDVRPFRPAADEAAWLDVNNRAFADHPEQGGWDLETLLEREAEPWFDPAGFLLHEEGGRLVGSCWTKVHAATTPPMGEIYVISVDPRAHQRGLGRALTVAGLDWLAGRGLSVGMLYVDADNDPALALYGSLGFRLDHLDRAYVAHLDG